MKASPARLCRRRAVEIATKETQYLRVYTVQLRRKLEPDPAKPRYLLTEAGMGYRFEPGTN